MAGPFSEHIAIGQPAQFSINRRGWLLQSRLIAVAPGKKQLGDLLR
jgi:hypothetical protein